MGLDPQWWGLVVVQWQGSVMSIGIGRPGVVASASVGGPGAMGGYGSGLGVFGSGGFQRWCGGRSAVELG